MAANDARPVPRKNTAFRFYFAIRKPSDSTLITTWAGADSEVSLDGASYSDCTNEATEIGTTGTGYIDLTAAEMNADAVLLKVTVTNTGAVPLVFTLFPEEAGDYRAAVTSMGANVIDAASIAADAITDAKVASDVTIASVTGAVGSVTGLTASDVAAIKAKTDNLPSDPADASDIASAFGTVNSTLVTIAGYVDTEVAAIKAKTDLIPAQPAAVGSQMDLIDAPNATALLAVFTKVLTTALTESYAADGAAPTLAQAIFLIQQSLHEFSISSTTRTVKKLDGSTTAAVFTLDSATAPTSTTRSA